MLKYFLPFLLLFLGLLVLQPFSTSSIVGDGNGDDGDDDDDDDDDDSGDDDGDDDDDGEW